MGNTGTARCYIVQPHAPGPEMPATRVPFLTIDSRSGRHGLLPKVLTCLQKWVSKSVDNLVELIEMYFEAENLVVSPSTSCTFHPKPQSTLEPVRLFQEN